MRGGRERRAEATTRWEGAGDVGGAGCASAAAALDCRRAVYERGELHQSTGKKGGRAAQGKRAHRGGRVQTLCTSRIQTTVPSQAPSMSVKPLSRELLEAKR